MMESDEATFQYCPGKFYAGARFSRTPTNLSVLRMTLLLLESLEQWLNCNKLLAMCQIKENPVFPQSKKGCYEDIT